LDKKQAKEAANAQAAEAPKANGDDNVVDATFTEKKD